MCCLPTISSCPVKEAMTRLLLWLLYFLKYLAHVGLFLFCFIYFFWINVEDTHIV